MGTLILRPTWSRALVGAAGQKDNLIVLGMSVLAKLALGSWWLFLLGISTYVLLTLRLVTSPRMQRRRMANELANPRLPESFQLQDPEVQRLVRAFTAGRSKINQVLAQTPDEVKTQLGPTLFPLEELQGCVARLVTRAEVLGHYLRHNPRQAITDEISHLDDLVRQTGDAVARREYETARSCRLDQLVALQGIARSQERATASLQRVVAVVEGLSSRIVNLCMLEARWKEDLAGDLSAALERISSELQTCEQIRGGLALLPEEALESLENPTPAYPSYRTIDEYQTERPLFLASERLP